MTAVLEGLASHCGTDLIGRQDLMVLPTPEPTATHVPVSHAKFVGALVEALGYRKLDVVAEGVHDAALPHRRGGALSTRRPRWIATSSEPRSRGSPAR